jgi:hypothetical protein
MKTLIYGAGPIGQWLALQLAEAGKDVTLLARGNTLQQLKTQGVVLLDGYTGERHAAHVPLAGAIIKCNDDLGAVGANPGVLRQFVLACREAGNVLRKVGYPQRQPPIFNLFYWTPLWLARQAFKPLFDSRFAEVAIGLHLKAIGNEFGEMVAEFSDLQQRAGVQTPNLDDLLGHVTSSEAAS